MSSKYAALAQDYLWETFLKIKPGPKGQRAVRCKECQRALYVIWPDGVWRTYAPAARNRCGLCRHIKICKNFVRVLASYYKRVAPLEAGAR